MQGVWGCKVCMSMQHVCGCKVHGNVVWDLSYVGGCKVYQGGCRVCGAAGYVGMQGVWGCRMRGDAGCARCGGMQGVGMQGVCKCKGWGFIVLIAHKATLNCAGLSDTMHGASRGLQEGGAPRCMGWDSRCLIDMCFPY